MPLPLRHRLRSTAWMADGIGLLSVFAMTAAAYQPVFSAGFIWDDNSYVTHNAFLSTLDGLRRIWLQPTVSPQYYPLTFTTFWLEYQAWGLWPVGYHVVNVLLHALNAVLAWRVFRQLKIPGAWWAAAVFALHPVHVESVAWITERKNLLSGLGFLVACWSYLRFDERRHAPTASPVRAWRDYALALLSFAAALLSKTIVCTLPAVLALMLWWRRRRLSRRDLLPLLPFLLLGAAMAVLTARLEAVRVGASGAAWNFSAVERALIASHAVWFYLGKLCWPAPLMTVYPRWTVDPTEAGSWGFLVAALVAVVGVWRLRSRWGPGPLLTVLAFVAMLSPISGAVNFYFMLFSFAADHFQYLASLAVIAAAVGGVATWAGRLGRAVKGVVPLAGALLIIGLGVRTWQQGQLYRSSDILWRDALRKNPAAWVAHHELGVSLLFQNRLEEAEAECRTTLAMKPDYSQAYNNLGNVLTAEGKFDAAIAAYTKALGLRADFMVAYRNLHRALRLQPRQPPGPAPRP